MDLIYKQAPLVVDASIRILELDTSTPRHAKLCGRLKSVSLLDQPDFIAVSYAWGTGPKSEVILIGDVPLHITQTLHSALVELSSKLEKVSLWVDQICVNQTNLSERANQVRLMYWIFTQARQVIAWLGEAIPESSIGMKLLQYLGDMTGDGIVEADMHACRPSYRTPDLSEVVSLEGVKCLNDFMERFFDFSRAAWTGAMSLVQQPLFSRLWVVQEILLAHDLEFRWGEHRLSGVSLFAALRMITTFLVHPVRAVHPFTVFEKAQALASLRMRLSSDQSISYVDLAHELSGWQCTDDRDRINALAGMGCKDVPPSILWPESSYMMSVTNLYIAFAMGYVHITRSLDILHFAGSSETVLLITDGGQIAFQHIVKTADLPSWTPDWRSTSRPLPLRKAPIGGQPSRSMEEAHIAIDGFPFDHTGRTLCVRAFLADEIAFVGPPLVVDPRYPWWKPDVIFKAWCEIARKVLAPAKSVDDRLALTLAMYEAQLPCRRYPDTPTAEQCLTGFAAWLPRLCSEAGSEKPEVCEDSPSQPELDVASNYGSRALDFCRQRSFFVTKAGKLGLGPAHTAVGMLVYLISGLGMPFILEKTPSTEAFVIRGDCYMEGVLSRFPAELQYEYLKLI